jgi:hypothetical protein
MLTTSSLTISLGMISCAEMQLGASKLEQFFPEIVGEGWVMIKNNRMRHAMNLEDLIHENLSHSECLIQMDIGGHPPFPTGSKQRSDIFGNLLFLVVFRVLNFWSRFEALNDVFWGMLRLQNYIMEFCQKCCSPRIDLSNELSYA